MIIRSKKTYWVPSAIQDFRIYSQLSQLSNVKSCRIQESCTNINLVKVVGQIRESLHAPRAIDDLKIYLTLKISEHSLMCSAITENGESAEEIPSEA